MRLAVPTRSLPLPLWFLLQAQRPSWQERQPWVQQPSWQAQRP